MTLTKDRTSGVVKISGTLDIDQANSLREALLEGFLREPEVVADLSAVEACDGAGLQVLVAGLKSAASFGKPFRLHAVSAAVLETARALGLSLDCAASDPGNGSSQDAN